MVLGTTAPLLIISLNRGVAAKLDSCGDARVLHDMHPLLEFLSCEYNQSTRSSECNLIRKLSQYLIVMLQTTATTQGFPE